MRPESTTPIGAEKPQMVSYSGPSVQAPAYLPVAVLVMAPHRNMQPKQAV